MAQGGLKKTLCITVVSLVVLAALLAAACGGLYWYSIKKNQPVEAITTVKLSAPETKLGQEVTAVISFKCPWHRKPIAAQATTGKGATLVEEPVITRKKIGVGYCVWNVTVDMKPYRTGIIPSGKLFMEFNRYDKTTKEIKSEFMIPPLKVNAIKLNAQQKLQIAGEIQPETFEQTYHKYIIIGGAVLIFIVIALIIMLFRKRKEKQTIITPWAAALIDLTELRSGMKSGSIGLEKCFSQLTDIVRGYLEKRFKAKATQQTTYEFLHDLRQSGGPLPDKHRPFLEEFMTAADLVKFAKLPPDQNILDNALNKAEKLVTETRPGLEEQNDGGQK
ncbi:MAG: hypothetical protein GY750_16740 [Lentisphaerae bacterium]|nr:hypothetical protein [Lentisphaerota bacterium]MCP4103045.1 hypothetical protein [Lentisphaerota bacterium]